MVGKSKRDSRLIMAVYNERESAHSAGESRTYCVVSSARLLKKIDNRFRKELHEPEMVLSLSALGFLLTLTPQVQMGFGTLKSILFDTYLATRFTPLQRLACRAIAASGQWEMPWSRRGTLNRKLRQRLLQEAKTRSVNVDELTDRFLRGENKEFSANIIADTLDEMAISPETQQQVRELKAQIKKINEEQVSGKKSPKSRISITTKDIKKFQRHKKRKK